MNTIKPFLITASKLAVFAGGAAVLLYVIYQFAQPAQQLNQQKALLLQLNTLVAAEHYNNALTEDKLTLSIPTLSAKKPVTVYRARKDQQPVASLLTVTAHNGYSGDIQLLVAIWADNRLAGVRVLAHKETPGLGDYIEAERDEWIHQFSDKSHQTTPQSRWKVKKDGGDFSYRTGATITPRAIVSTVEKTLAWVSQHQDEVYAPLATPSTGGRP
jgi:electron transport complex protein RnfG